MQVTETTSRNKQQTEQLSRTSILYQTYVIYENFIVYLSVKLKVKLWDHIKFSNVL